MLTRTILLICAVVAFVTNTLAQTGACTFKPPFYKLHFGRGNVQDINNASLAHYNRISSSCPSDGYYTFTASTSDCFGGDWHTLAEDHTPGDAGGNMLLVNSAFSSGTFLVTRIKGFKGAKDYQVGAWLINVCKPSRKCPFPLLPNLTFRLQTPSGKTVALFATGELQRRETPLWSQHLAQFTMPASETELMLTLTNSAPGGCGNDFALDDITFRECVRTEPATLVQQKKVPPVAKKQQPVAKKEVKKTAPVPTPVNRNKPIATVAKVENEPQNVRSLPGPQPAAFVPVPLVLKNRTNALVRTIETDAGEIRLDLYDNGEIDGDTVSIFHNNKLIVSSQRLSQKPISFRIQVDKAQPRHELVMVAENLGSIPPNTSLLIVTANDKRYQVYISSTEQKNAKVVIDLKE